MTVYIGNGRRKLWLMCLMVCVLYSHLSGYTGSRQRTKSAHRISWKGCSLTIWQMYSIIRMVATVPAGTCHELWLSSPPGPFSRRFTWTCDGPLICEYPRTEYIMLEWTYVTLLSGIWTFYHELYLTFVGIIGPWPLGACTQWPPSIMMSVAPEPTRHAWEI